MNPYQQNIDIIKGFFKRKIVLLYAILTILPVFSIIFINIKSVFDYVDKNGYNKLLEDIPQNGDMVNSTASVYILFIFDILISVAFLLFFVKAGSKDSSLKAPIGIFRVVSIIQFVITAFVSVGMVFIVLITALFTIAHCTVMTSLLTVPFLFILIPAVFLQVLFQTVFAGNIKESVNSIYLKKRGAKLYGILNLVMAVLCAYVAVIIAIFCVSDILIFIPVICFFGLSALKYLAGAAVGIKFSDYIENFSDGSTSKNPETEKDDEDFKIIVCKKCGKPLTSDDYFCNHCGTPVEK